MTNVDIKDIKIRASQYKLVINNELLELKTFLHKVNR